MGLDMYLRAEVYIGGWEHAPATERARYKRAIKLAGLGADFSCEGSPSVTIDVNVAYWRKANQIHAWFVNNVQDGVDECQRAYVTREQLTELRDTCRKVLDSSELHDGLVQNGYTLEDDGEGGYREKPILEEGKMMVVTTVAEELLPAQSGFFFGSTEYNEWYVQDLRDTVEQIDKVLSMRGDVDFYYQSSW